MSSNVEILKSAYARWHDSKAGDIEGWLAIFAPDGVIGSLAAGAPGAEFSQSRFGVDGLRQYLHHLTRDWEMLDQKMDDFIADGDRIAVLGDCTWRRRADGRDVYTPKCDIWRFKDGKVVEFFEFYDTAALLGIT